MAGTYIITVIITLTNSDGTLFTDSSFEWTLNVVKSIPIFTSGLSEININAGLKIIIKLPIISDSYFGTITVVFNCGSIA